MTDQATHALDALRTASGHVLALRAERDELAARVRELEAGAGSGDVGDPGDGPDDPPTDPVDDATLPWTPTPASELPPRETWSSSGWSEYVLRGGTQSIADLTLHTGRRKGLDDDGRAKPGIPGWECMDLRLSNVAMTPLVQQGVDDVWRQDGGTKWAARLSNVCDGLIHDLYVERMFGPCYLPIMPGPEGIRTSMEGHGLYLNLRAQAGRELLVTSYLADELGGHALYLVNSDARPWQDRSHEGLPGEPGGEVTLRGFLFANTDQAPYRGSYAIEIHDIRSDVLIEDGAILQDYPVMRSGQSAFDPVMRSRGAINVTDRVGDVTLRNVLIDLAGVCEHQNPVGFTGPPTVTLERVAMRSQNGRVMVNSDWQLANKPGIPVTRRLVTRGCAGDVEVWARDVRLGVLGDDLDVSFGDDGRPT